MDKIKTRPTAFICLHLGLHQEVVSRGYHKKEEKTIAASVTFMSTLIAQLPQKLAAEVAYNPVLEVGLIDMLYKGNFLIAYFS